MPGAAAVAIDDKGETKKAAQRLSARRKRRNGFPQSGCDRSTILARARFQPRYCTWKAAPTVFGDRLARSIDARRCGGDLVSAFR
jgi:hypothetical protein